jgi:hypothetical protein
MYNVVSVHLVMEDFSSVFEIEQKSKTYTLGVYYLNQRTVPSGILTL